jgi:Flp pilus assembly protein TadB
MSDDRERGSDGLLIGILVVLVVLVFGGMGLAFFGLRFSRVEAERAVMAERMAREQAELARMKAELARQAEERARVEIEQLKSQSKESAPELPPGDTRPPDGSIGERDARK